MAVNYKELELLLSEIPLVGSYVQDVTEHDYHSFTLSLFNSEKKAYLVYTEIATPHSRFCMTDHMRKKSPLMQRFTQYLRAHIRGKKITSLRQLPFDRAFTLTLSSPSDEITLLFRLYSGSGANVIALDSDNKILELMFRRPKRNEISGKTLTTEERKDEGDKHYEVRDWSGGSFNKVIDEEESGKEKDEKREEYLLYLLEKRNRELSGIDGRIKKEEETLEKTKGWEETLKYASLLQSSMCLVKKGMKEVTLHDWESDEDITLSLDERLSPNENLEKLYTRYRKDKNANKIAIEEKERLLREKEEIIKKYSSLLSPDTPLDKLKKEKDKESERDDKRIEGRPGLYLTSGGWDIIVGRSAKENDEILRHYSKGNDLWLHTRDFSGGYIIIKAKKGKSVPLEVLLDASYLAIFFSKARRNNRADIYYTQVKNLKRIKGAKTGLVIPTQEKILHVDMDEKRVRLLLK